jgi:hypothetical protein
MKRLLWTVIAVAGLGSGQEKASTPAPPKMVQKIIDVKYADADRVSSLVNGPGLSIRADNSMHALVVYGTAEAVATVEEMVKRLDTAPANIELTVYLISGSTQSASEDLPKELGPTAKQLHALFPYKGYRLLESFVQRARDGREGSTSGALSAGSIYDFRYRSATVSSGTPRVVHINNLALGIRTPTANRDKEGRVVYNSVGINTDIDVGDGQKVVVGKSSIDGTGDALILVVTAKVVE